MEWNGIELHAGDKVRLTDSVLFIGINGAKWICTLDG